MTTSTEGQPYKDRSSCYRAAKKAFERNDIKAGVDYEISPVIMPGEDKRWWRWLKITTTAAAPKPKPTQAPELPGLPPAKIVARIFAKDSEAVADAKAQLNNPKAVKNKHFKIVKTVRGEFIWTPLGEYAALAPEPAPKPKPKPEKAARAPRAPAASSARKPPKMLPPGKGLKAKLDVLAALLKRKNGATMEEILAALPGWSAKTANMRIMCDLRYLGNKVALSDGRYTISE